METNLQKEIRIAELINRVKREDKAIQDQQKAKNEVKSADGTGVTADAHSKGKTKQKRGGIKNGHKQR